jgi:hypothetical protein
VTCPAAGLAKNCRRERLIGNTPRVVGQTLAQRVRHQRRTDHIGPEVPLGEGRCDGVSDAGAAARHQDFPAVPHAPEPDA